VRAANPAPKKLAALEADWYEADLERISLVRKQLELDIERSTWENRLTKGQPIREGNFVFAGTVEEESVFDLMAKLTTWSNLHPGQPVTLYIDSGGGFVTDGYTLYDFLRSISAKGHHITTHGLGMAASMAAVLMQAGDTRVMSPHSWMMIHEVSFGASGKFSAMKNMVDFNKRLQDQAAGILTARSKWTKRRLLNAWKDDVWLDAQQALKEGFIDEVRA
jgi:ATP-dependent Clp protease protease subunit